MKVTSGFVSEAGTWAKTASGEYDLSGVQLKINGGSGSVVPDSDFKLHVPHLKDILQTADTIHNDLLHGQQHNSQATIDYEHGSLGIAGCYIDEIKFDPPTALDPRCLAQKVELDFVAGSNWRIEDKNNSGKYIELQAAAVVDIRNFHASSGAHQKHYSKLLTNNSVVRDMLHTGKKCSSGCVATAAPQTRKRRVRLSQFVECSNTQWP